MFLSAVPYCTVMALSVQARSVRVLYRRILTLHRKLPLEMKALGDEYARAEFKRHKKVGQAEAANFVKEWTVSFHFLLHFLFLFQEC